MNNFKHLHARFLSRHVSAIGLSTPWDPPKRAVAGGDPQKPPSWAASAPVRGHRNRWMALSVHSAPSRSPDLARWDDRFSASSARRSEVDTDRSPDVRWNLAFWKKERRRAASKTRNCLKGPGHHTGEARRVRRGTASRNRRYGERGTAASGRSTMEGRLDTRKPVCTLWIKDRP